MEARYTVVSMDYVPRDPTKTAVQLKCEGGLGVDSLRLRTEDCAIKPGDRVVVTLTVDNTGHVA
jgi:hypothetical protein